MKTMLEKNKCWVILIVFGLFITAGSLVYNFAITNHNSWIMSGLFIIDTVLLYINMYLAFNYINNSRKKVFINSFIGCLLYICVFIMLGLCIIEDGVTLEIFLEVLKTAIFVGPSVVVFFCICAILG